MHILNPFAPLTKPIPVQGSIVFSGRSVTLTFSLIDNDKLVEDSFTPSQWRRDHLTRADNLWKTTCFEAFWAVPGFSHYWELNISANSPRWNLYRFEDYRLPQPPQASKDFEMDSLSTTDQTLECKLLGNSVHAKFEASLCAVVRTADSTHYYSTNHAGEKADFHNRVSFTLR